MLKYNVYIFDKMRIWFMLFIFFFMIFILFYIVIYIYVCVIYFIGNILVDKWIVCYNIFVDMLVFIYILFI